MTMMTAHVFTATLLCLSMARGLAFAEPPEATPKGGSPAIDIAGADASPTPKSRGVGVDTPAGPAGADLVGEPMNESKPAVAPGRPSNKPGHLGVGADTSRGARWCGRRRQADRRPESTRYAAEPCGGRQRDPGEEGDQCDADAGARTELLTASSSSGHARRQGLEPIVAGVVVDRIYERQNGPIGDFSFNHETAGVFEDMLGRSVPFYEEIQRMIRELAGDFAADGTNVYDLGCSAGTTLVALDDLPSAGSPRRRRCVTGDDRESRVEPESSGALRIRTRCLLPRSERRSPGRERLRRDSLPHASVRSPHLARANHSRRFETASTRTAASIVVEKVLAEESLLNRFYIRHYYDLKRRNGYSELEIARKREALENVLIPYRLTENEEMLKNAGFHGVDVFFKWFNFCGLVALR